ncbi:protein kinase [Streptomyces physcomitrii]|uniref:protein kinase domain-containing protein n=1 Tax=Streptomyces physcomitrii TaxID=2724184 RepID=UPI0033E2BAAC
MEEYAGRVLAGRYRLPLPTSGGHEISQTRAFDTYSGQEVLVRQVPLPEVVEAEVLDSEGLPEGYVSRGGRGGAPGAGGRVGERGRTAVGGRGEGAEVRSSPDPVVQRAIEAAQAAAQVPDHPRLDQVFDVFAEGGSLWIVTELVAARSLAAFLADEPLSPYRAAEVAADVVTALRALHAHGWVHRNITARTVLICDDGRVMLTGLAAGAAEEALCGYDPRPEPPHDGPPGPGGALQDDTGSQPVGGPRRGPGQGGPEDRGTPGPARGGARTTPAPEGAGGSRTHGLTQARQPGVSAALPEGYGRGAAALPEGTGRGPAGEGRAPDQGRAREAQEAPRPGTPGSRDRNAPYGDGSSGPGDSGRPPRAGSAIAAYQAGTRAAARHSEQQQRGRQADEEQRAQQAREQRGESPYGRQQQPGPSPNQQQPGPSQNQPQSPDAPHGRQQSPDAPYGQPQSPDAPYGGRQQSPDAPYGHRQAPGTTQGPQQRPVAPSAPQGQGAQGRRGGAPGDPSAPVPSRSPHSRPGDSVRSAPEDLVTPPGRIADPYGVHGAPAGPWHGAVPRGEAGEQPPAPRPTGLPPLPLGWDRDPAGAGTSPYGPGEPAPHGELPYGAGESTHGETPADSGPGTDSGPGPGPGTDSGPDADFGSGSGRSAVYGETPYSSRQLAPRGEVPHDSRELTPYGESPYGAEELYPEDDPHAQDPAADADPHAERSAPSWPSGWDVPEDQAPVRRRGPATALAAERARQARMAVVGPVTERWAPEQAGPVHENWQLAAPIGPATDLWALGALLFRAVQGYAPYPEDSTSELVQLVCAEPPAFAEECGPLRPVVESLLRQDPTERLDFEELRGWLRSLVRSAPEPEAGAHVVAGPPADPHLLPIVRRRGELVRRWRRRGAAKPARHKRAAREAAAREQHVAREHAPVRERPARQAPAREKAGRERPARPKPEPRAPREPRIGKKRPAGRGGREPRSLGRTLLILVLVGLVGALAFAMLFLPKSGENAGGDNRPGSGDATGQQPGPTSEESPGEDGGESGDPQNPGSEQPQTTNPELPAGYALRKDKEGFQVQVPESWTRTPKNGRKQVRYTNGQFTLLITPGRDSTATFGDDPMSYQREREYELQPFRDSTWATSSGMRSIDVGGRRMAEGQFTWQESDGREVFVRNLAMVFGGRYHVLQVIGPETQRDEVTRFYEQASASYRFTG